jgi:cholinesterase
MMSLVTAFFALAPLVAAVPQAAVSSWKIGQEAKTTSGSIQGHASTYQPQVSEYLGIPYALPPVGQLRFAAPKPYVGNGTFKADKFSPDCPAS